MKNNSGVTGEQVLSQTMLIEAQRNQKAILDSLQDNKEFDMVSKKWWKAEPD